jgi:hypothetical protein
MTLNPAQSRCLLAAAAFLLLAACSDTGPRVYTAQPYDPAVACLGEYESIGLVEADELPASCEPTCLAVSETVYVTTLCAPYPDLATPLTADESEDCAAALQAEACP